MLRVAPIPQAKQPLTIKELAETVAGKDSMALLEQLQQHYQMLMCQLVQLRQIAMAMEGILGRD